MNQFSHSNSRQLSVSVDTIASVYKRIPKYDPAKYANDDTHKQDFVEQLFLTKKQVSFQERPNLEKGDSKNNDDDDVVTTSFGKPTKAKPLNDTKSTTKASTKSNIQKQSKKKDSPLSSDSLTSSSDNDKSRKNNKKKRRRRKKKKSKQILQISLLMIMHHQLPLRE